MGRTSANNLRVLAAEVGRVQERLHRSADEARTVRKVVPWKEVAERKANAASPPWKQQQTDDAIEPPPDSGVRSGLDAGLSYTVYSVAELENRPRSSMPPPMSVVMPSRWPDVGRSAKALLHAWWSFYVRATPRPHVMEVCRVPLMTLRADLGAALMELPWKKIGIRAAIGVGSVLILLFSVIAVAEFTDDLKPARTAANRIEAPKLEAPPAEPSAAVMSIEIEDAPVAAAPPVKKPAVKTKPPAKKTAPASPGKKSKGPDIFVP